VTTDYETYTPRSRRELKRLWLFRRIFGFTAATSYLLGAAVTAGFRWQDMPAPHVLVVLDVVAIGTAVLFLYASALSLYDRFRRFRRLVDGARRAAYAGYEWAAERAAERRRDEPEDETTDDEDFVLAGQPDEPQPPNVQVDADRNRDVVDLDLDEDDGGEQQEEDGEDFQLVPDEEAAPWERKTDS
jgi:hypothetical protein